jgi:hypothetical protein
MMVIAPSAADFNAICPPMPRIVDPPEVRGGLSSSSGRFARGG